MKNKRELFVEHKYEDGSAEYELLYERAAMYLDHTREMSFLEEVMKKARSARIERSGKEESAQELDEAVKRLISQIDTRKYAFLEAYFSGYEEKHVDFEYLHLESPLKDEFVLFDKDVDNKLIAALESIVEMPIQALYTPELNRYYYEMVSQGAQRGVYAEAYAENMAEKDFLMADFLVAAPELAREEQAWHEQFNRENDIFAQLIEKEAEAARALLECRLDMREQRTLGREASADSLTEYERREAELFDAFVEAQRRVIDYRQICEAELAKQKKEYKITDFMHFLRTEQLRSRDFSYLPMSTPTLMSWSGQRTVSERLEGDVETRRYSVLDDAAKAEAMDDAIYDVCFNMLKRVMDVADDILLRKMFAEQIENGQWDIKTAVKQSISALEDSRKRAVEALAERERNAVITTMQRAINDIGGNRYGYDENQRNFYNWLLEQERTEITAVADIKAQMYALDIKLSGLELIELVEENVLDYYSSKEVSALYEAKEKRRELETRLEAYKTERLHQYGKLMHEGYITREFFDAKELSILGGFDRFALGDKNPFEGIDKDKFASKAPRVDLLGRYDTELAKADELVAEVEVSRARLAKGGKTPSARQVKKLIAEAEEKTTRAAKMKKEVFKSINRITQAKAIEQNRLLSKGEHYTVALALDELWEKEAMEIAEFASIHNKIAACDSKLVGYIIASDLKMEKKIYSEEQLKEFGDIVWQKGKLLRQLQVLKEQYTAYYKEKLEAGVFTEEFVAAKLDAIEGGNQRGFIMAEHTPIADIGRYAKIQEQEAMRKNEVHSQEAGPEEAVKKALEEVQRINALSKESIYKNSMEAMYNEVQSKDDSEKQIRENAKNTLDDPTRAPVDEQEKFRKMLRSKLVGTNEPSSAANIKERLEKAIAQVTNTEPKVGDVDKLKLTVENVEKEQKANEDEPENEIYGNDEKEFSW